MVKETVSSWVKQQEERNTAPLEGIELVRAIGGQLIDKKAERIVVLDVKAQQTFCDYIIVCHGNSDRHVQALAAGAIEGLKRIGSPPLGAEGIGMGHWVLVDFGDVVVHAFYAPVRDYYDLEGLWAEAERVDLKEWGPRD